MTGYLVDTNIPSELTRDQPDARVAGFLRTAEFEELVFARIKFFTAGLPEENRENYYMEREWRLHDGLPFRLGDIARIFLPRGYCQQFHEDVPDYTGEVFPVCSV